MFTRIRGAPYTGNDGSWIAGGYQNQFGQEVQVVALICTNRPFPFAYHKLIIILAIRWYSRFFCGHVNHDSTLPIFPSPAKTADISMVWGIDACLFRPGYFVQSQKPRISLPASFVTVHNNIVLLAAKNKSVVFLLLFIVVRAHSRWVLVLLKRTTSRSKGCTMVTI